MTTSKLSYKWTDEATNAFIQLRGEKYAEVFTGQKQSSRIGWLKVLEDLNLSALVSVQQAKDRWGYLLKTYKELKTKHGNNPDAVTWKFFDAINQVQTGGRRDAIEVSGTCEGSDEGWSQSVTKDTTLASTYPEQSALNYLNDSDSAVSFKTVEAINDVDCNQSTSSQFSGRKWSDEATLEFIRVRTAHRNKFTGQKRSAVDGWTAVANELNINERISLQQFKDKWSYLVRIYKQCKLTGERWKFYSQMEAAIGDEYVVEPLSNDDVNNKRSPKKFNVSSTCKPNSAEIQQAEVGIQPAPEVKQVTHKWTEEETRLFIRLRSDQKQLFASGQRNLIQDGYSSILKELGLTNKVTYQQAKDRWNYLHRIYKQYSSQQGGLEISPGSWPFYADMDRAVSADVMHGATPVAVAQEEPEPILGIPGFADEVDVVDFGVISADQMINFEIENDDFQPDLNSEPGEGRDNILVPADLVCQGQFMETTTSCQESRVSSPCLKRCSHQGSVPWSEADLNNFVRCRNEFNSLFKARTVPVKLAWRAVLLEANLVGRIGLKEARRKWECLMSDCGRADEIETDSILPDNSPLEQDDGARSLVKQVVRKFKMANSCDNSGQSESGVLLMECDRLTANLWANYVLKHNGESGAALSSLLKGVSTTGSCIESADSDQRFIPNARLEDVVSAAATAGLRVDNSQPRVVPDQQVGSVASSVAVAGGETECYEEEIAIERLQPVKKRCLESKSDTVLRKRRRLGAWQKLADICLIKKKYLKPKRHQDTSPREFNLFICPLCGLTIHVDTGDAGSCEEQRQETVLNDHFLTTHKDSLGDDTCPVCLKLESAATLVDHIRTHVCAGFKCLKCSCFLPISCEVYHRRTCEGPQGLLCQYYSDFFSFYVMHVDGTRNVRHRCKVCDQEYKALPRMEEHQRRHRNLQPVTCTLCGLSFNCDDYLKSHMTNKHNEKKLQCEFCGKNYAKVSHLRVHKENNHLGDDARLQCPMCEKKVVRSQFKRHTDMHMGTAKRHMCDICGKDFCRLTFMKQHRKKVHKKLLTI